MSRLIKSDRTLARARRLRREMSDEERILWMLLRDRRFAAFKFRRQVPLGDYVGDFVCFQSKLVVELDGSQHADAEKAAFDARRTKYLEMPAFALSGFGAPICSRSATAHLKQSGTRCSAS